MNPNEFITVITTCDNEEALSKIAFSLIEKKLAACVQIMGPIKSTYYWQGKIETSSEWLCQIKTVGHLYGKVEREIKSMHPYTTPEIIAHPIVQGSESYLEWIRENVN
ncbi:MAG: divalent-cation tolerance protein CutA [Syntrophales bacterium]|nr:divalent-cation tolerance protein CutA [Syntrophales bacterium]